MNNNAGHPDSCMCGQCRYDGMRFGFAAMLVVFSFLVCGLIGVLIAWACGVPIGG